MGCGRWRLPLLALALLVIAVSAAVALTPTERAEAQSVPSVYWPSGTYQVLESEDGIFGYQASRISSAGIDVRYTIGGTATCGTDYTIPGANCNARTGTFTIPALTPAFTTFFLPITALEDEVSDSGETVILTITDGADYNLGSGRTTTITIFEQSGRSAFRISGRPQVNGVLTGNRVCADTDGEGSLSYLWLWNENLDPNISRWRDISGATSQSYTLQQSDLGNYIQLRIRHTDGKGLLGDVYTQTIGPIGPGAFDNTVKFSRESYNVREGDPLRPTLTFSSPTAEEQTFVIGFNACDAELPEDINADAYGAGNQYLGANRVNATHSVTVPAGVTRHTFSLPVVLDGEIEEAETFVMSFDRVPSGFTIGSQTDATNQGTQARVQITDVNLVPENWSLKPSGISAGNQFRLLFKTENERNAQSGDIGVYDTFVRNRIGGASTGHADIRRYRDTFRVVGSTGTVDAAWHTATGIMVSGEPGHTPFSHRIYWMGGPKIADDYNDFWDGTWDNDGQTGPNQRNALGVVTTSKRGPNTGTKSGTTHATAGTKANMYLGHSTTTRWGGSMASHNPINQGNIPVGDNNVYIGLSGIFLPLDVSAANPLVTIETGRTRVVEGRGIRYTLRAVPAPSSPVTVEFKVSETTEGGLNFVNPADHGPRTITIPTSGVATFTVRTVNDDLGEADGGVTVSIGAGSGYRTLAGYDTVMTAITSEDEASTLSAGVRLGNGSNGPAQTGANVDFTFSLAEARESELEGIRTQLAWGGDVISPRSDRPTTWDEFAVNPAWKPDGSARVNHRGAYVRPWLESSILIGQQSFGRRVHVKNHAEAGGAVGDGWVAMRVDTDAADHYDAEPGAEWACMPVGNGTCPSAWPGVPTASIVPLDKEQQSDAHGRVMSGNDARYRVTVSPAPGTGETRRVYLKTWEVFITAIDRPTLNDKHCELPDGVTTFDPDEHCDPPPRKGERQVQFEAYAHVDVGSSGSAEFTMPTKPWRSTENMRGRNYWAQVQEDVAYSVGGSSRAEVRTKIYNPAEAVCWYGHTHYPASAQYVKIGPIDVAGLKQLARHGAFGVEFNGRSGNFGPFTFAIVPHDDHIKFADFNSDGVVNELDLDRSVLPARYHHWLDVRYEPAMGITPCLTKAEIDDRNDDGSYRPVWTTRKVDYGHLDNHHPETTGSDTHHHHHHSSTTAPFGDGMHFNRDMQTLGEDSQDGSSDDQQTEDSFPAPGVLGFSDVATTSMTVSWPEREVDRYLIYWGDAAGDDDVQVIDVDGDTHSYTLSGLKPGTEYAVIVYSQDYDEVTSTGYWSTAATSCTPNLPSDAITVSEVKTWRSEYSQDSHVSRWNRVLAALGEDTGEAAMTADQAREIKSRIDNTRWDRTVRTLEALEQCAGSTDTTPAATPEVSIASNGDITEGGSASFTLTANPAPASALSVSVSVSQTGDYGVSTGSQTVSIPTGGSYTLAVATVNDSTDEADGSVTATVSSGTGYTVSGTAGAATVAVADDDAAPQSCTPNLPSDAITVSEVKTWRGEYSQDSHVSRWNRVLAALGEDTGEAAMTAEQAREIKSRIDNTRWDRTVRTLDAMEKCSNPPAATPEVSVTAGSGITEGGDASFTVTANPAPTADLSVSVSVAVTQSGDYGVATGSQTMSIPTGGSYTLTIATVNDGTDEADGSVTVTVGTGQGYTVSTAASSATVAVADDDVPEISITAGSGITEGGNASFILTANPAPHAPLTVSVSVSQSGDFGVTPGSQTVSIPTGGSATLTVATGDDSVDEADGSVTATVSSGTGYIVSGTAGAATVAVADDDAALPGTPEISITAGSDITEGGNATFTLTANPAPTADLSVSVSVAQTGDYGATPGSQTVTIPTGGSATLAVATVNDGVDEADGSVTATVNAGQDYTVSGTARSATVAVADDDVPEISITAGSGITEGGDASFTLTANPAPHAPLSVSVSVSQSGDFGATTGSQTVSIPTSGSYTLTVATVNDGADEADGSVTATVDGGTDYTVSSTAGAATVAVADDDDPPPPDATPSLSVSDGSAREDAGVMEFTVTLSAPSDKKVQVMAATTYFRYKTATVGDDFEGARFPLTFAPGETSKTVQVVILDDDLSEGDESFGLYLAYTPTNTPIAREHGEGVIIDDD